MCGNNIETQVTVTHSSPVSPPPYMVGMVEIELDKETGQVDILDYVAVVDCGTVINTNLARVQTEGGLVQGIGMALYEDVQYTKRGAIPENSFMQYKIPTRLDMGKLELNLKVAMNQLVHLVQNRLVKLLLIHHLLQLPMLSIEQRVNI